MSKKVQTYDPKKVMVIWGGVVITGYAEGSMVNCEKNEESSTHAVGAQGEVTQIINSDDTGTVTISLKGNSPSLSMLAADAQSHVIKPLQVIDMNTGGLNAGGTEAWVTKTPDLNKGKEVEDIDVEILVADYSVVQ